MKCKSHCVNPSFHGELLNTNTAKTRGCQVAGSLPLTTDDTILHVRVVVRARLCGRCHKSGQGSQRHQRQCANDCRS